MSQPIQRVGQYNFLKKLGSGRMAEVYLGRIEGAEGFQKPVAIKKILPHLSSDLQFVQSLIAEARVGGQLHHRNIVEVYDFIRYGNDYCIIMEYVDGVDLGRILRSARRYRVRIPPAAALYIASHICDGLDYAHSARGFNGEPLNIIHRDLKPSNILISIKGGVKISDFGIARVMEQAVQRSPGDVKVSYQYQSPEQATGGGRLTAASDIFSVGVILFEMLTLEPLFPGKNVLEVLEGLRKGDFSQRLALAQRQLPGSEKILATALDPDPEQRYRTARMMAEDIRRLLLYLKVDDPRERLVTFFARLVRFVQEQGKRAPAPKAAPEEAAASGGAGPEIEADEGERDQATMVQGGAPEGASEPDHHAPAHAAAVSSEQGASLEPSPDVDRAEAPPAPGTFSTHAEPGGAGTSAVGVDGHEQGNGVQAGTELEMPMGDSYASSEVGAERGYGEAGGGGQGHGAQGAADAWVQQAGPVATPDAGSLGDETPIMPKPATMPADINPEETRIGTYSTVQQETTPFQGTPPPQPPPDEATRILPAGAPPVPPPPAAPQTGAAAPSPAFDDTVDSGDGTALLPVSPAVAPARQSGGKKVRLAALGIVIVLALGGAGYAVWQHFNEQSVNVVDSAHKRCPVCGHILPADASFCGYCGANLEQDNQQGAQEAIVKCPYCGADNDPDAVFCANCGKKLPKH